MKNPFFSNTNIKTLILLFLSIAYNLSYAQSALTSTPKAPLSASEIVEIIASDEAMGRLPGSEGMEKATAYIEGYLRMLQIKPLFNTSSYRDTFNIGNTETYNIVGLIPAKTKSTEYIVIGAHIDHIGIKQQTKNDSICNGANDNATGVATVLKIAEALTKSNNNVNIIISIFSGEELGLLGSTHLALKLSEKNIKPLYMLSIEMLGVPLTNYNNQVYITGYSMSNFAQVANKALNETFIIEHPVDKAYNLFERSDNYPFYEAFKTPSHTICSFDFENFKYYHKVQDDFSLVNSNFLNQTSSKIAKLITILVETNYTITNN